MRCLLFTFLLAFLAPEFTSFGRTSLPQGARRALPNTRQAASIQEGVKPSTDLPPRLPKGQYLIVKSNAQKALPIRGKGEVSVNAKDSAFFELSPLGANKAVLRFVTRDRDLYLDSNAELLIHFPPQYPYKVTPSILTKQQWSMKANAVTLQLSGTPPHGGSVHGRASYAVCSRKKKKCNYLLTKIESFLQISSR